MTAVIEETATGFGAYVEEVPGVGVVGDTLTETVDRLRAALVMHFEADPSAIPLTFKSQVGTLTLLSRVPFLRGDARAVIG